MNTDLEERNTNVAIVPSSLIKDTCDIIESARNNAARAVNVALTIRNWKLGERISKENFEGAERAEYGKQIIQKLAGMLTDRFGKGLDFSSLYKYIKFYKYFPNILDTVSPKCGKVDAVRPQLLPWTHYRELIRVENEEARNFSAYNKSPAKTSRRLSYCR